MLTGGTPTASPPMSRLLEGSMRGAGVPPSFPKGKRPEWQGQRMKMSVLKIYPIHPTIPEKNLENCSLNMNNWWTLAIKNELKFRELRRKPLDVHGFCGTLFSSKHPHGAASFFTRVSKTWGRSPKRDGFQTHFRGSKVFEKHAGNSFSMGGASKNKNSSHVFPSWCSRVPENLNGTW